VLGLVAASDVAYGRFQHTPAHHPLSLHARLTRGDASGDAFPHAPSASHVQSSAGGVLLQLAVEPQQTTTDPSSAPHTLMTTSVDSHDDHLRIRHLSTRSFLARSVSSSGLSSPPAPAWVGVEIGNLTGREETRARWMAQTYVLSAPGQQQILDHSLFVRINRQRKATALDSRSPSTSSSSAAAFHPSGSSFIFQHSVLANVGAALSTAPSSASSSASPSSAPKDLLHGTLTLGYDSSLHASPLRAAVFGATDGKVVGGRVWKRWDRAPTKRHTTTAADGERQFRQATIVGSLRAASWWPFQTSLQLGATSLGTEFAWVQAAKDYSASFGASQQFSWIRELSSSSGAAIVVPPCTLSASMQFYGHIQSSLHVPLTRRLHLSTLLHYQLTNRESLLVSAIEYRLNQNQSISAAVDSRGGLRAAVFLQPTPRAHGKVGGDVWWRRVWSRLRFAVQLQAFPIFPSLQPAWNIPHTGVTGASYDQRQVARARQPQVTVGLSLEYVAD
jgi:hypothetical protein